MRSPLTIITTTAVGVCLVGAGAAQAAEKPVEPKGPAVQAPDAAAAKAAKFAKERSALGSYYDQARGAHVVVVGKKSALTEAAVDKAIGDSARLERRSITKATSDAIQDKVAKRQWADAAAKYNYATWLDLETGKVVLNTNAPESVTDPLTDQYPGLIDQRHEAVEDTFNRKADVPAFWGGSSIKNGGGVCSSGFVVKKPTGQRFLTTAGHCFGVGANVLTTNGNLSVGNVTQRGPFLPWPLMSFDMELIGGKSYGSSIFVGGTLSSTGKHVNGAGDPVVGFANYCRSGQTSGEQCGERVQSVNATVCTQTGCKAPVISYTGPVSQPGDSGAPFYVYSTDGTQVYIRGMNIASGGSTSYAEKWSRISSNLGVTIVT